MIGISKRGKHDETFWQYAMHASTANCVRAVFSTDALVYTLGQSMELVNYSVALRKALANARDHFLGDKQVTGKRLIQLRNRITQNTAKAGVQSWGSQGVASAWDPQLQWQDPPLQWCWNGGTYEIGDFNGHPLPKWQWLQQQQWQQLEQQQWPRGPLAKYL